MQGTLVCAVTRGEESADAVAVGAELSERLGLRLVLALAVDGIDGQIGGGDGSESVSMKAGRELAEKRLWRLAADFGVLEQAQRRVGVGEPATWLARIIAEEAADMVVVGSTVRGWRRRFESRLATELEVETAVPVLIAPPRTPRAAIEDDAGVRALTSY